MPKLQVSLFNTSPMRLGAAFDCEPGELVALVGPSGSGKTSVLRAIAGLLKTPSLSGSVSVGDEVWFHHDPQNTAKPTINLSPQDRRVGLVFQNYALFPHLSAIKNVAIGASNTPANGKNSPKNAYSTDSADLHALFERLGLAGLEHRLPSELSGGQQQRVALARALARQPKVLLLDEPFSAVDAPSRQTLYRELAQLRSSVSTPMVLVTHDLQEARRLADRVVILDQGLSLQSGTPEQIFTRPRNARVAELVGIQNHFHGQFLKDRPDEAVTESSPPGWGQLKWRAAATVSPNAPSCASSAAQTQADVILSLQVVDKHKLEHGVQVTWVLAAELVDVLPDRYPQQTPPQNTLRCRLVEVLALGETSICSLEPLVETGIVGGSRSDAVRLTLTLSSAHLRSLALQKDATVWVHIPSSSIHIMPMRP
jgi:molybdate transport system ATP-binding protein